MQLCFSRDGIIRTMIDIPVVLVLGAGASFPYGFPLGQGLRDKALKPPASDLPQALAGIHDSLAMQLPEFQSELRSARRRSVDAFLEARPEFEALGKLVIAYHLMRIESEEKLYAVNSEEDWYQYLIEMMLTDGFEGFQHNKLAILTYNYDRSLEYYMFKMLKGCGRSDAECRTAMQGIPILHLHGQLGLLPELTDEGRRYENTIDSKRLQHAAKGIRIVHDDSLENDDVFTEAQTRLKQAHYVIFLGFGYLAKNVERLKLSEFRTPDTSYWGTGVKVRTSEAQYYARQFPKEIALGAPRKRINIDTGVKSVLDYISGNLHLFME